MKCTFYVRLFSAACAVSLLAAGCSDGVEAELVWRGIPIINGTYDTSPEHAAVVAIYDNWGLCTGTLISAEVVLTAAHCAQSSVSRYTILFGNSVHNASSRAVREKWVHPNYDGNRIVNDIAMFRLAAPAPSNVVPIPYLPASMGITSADVGEMLEFVGFGEDENGNAGVKLRVENQLDWVCTRAGGCNLGGGMYASQNTICYDESPGGPCSGDSGGPAFVTRQGRQYVAGITSYGDQNCQYFGCSTKVDAFEQYIVDFAGGELGSPCASDAQCDSGHCADGVCCDSACEGECMGCNVPGSIGTCRVLPDGSSCSDGDACNGEETCQQGTCKPGQPPDCSVQNPCIQAGCLPQQGCVQTPVPDGTPCPDSNVCDGTEVCKAGTCTAGQPLDCDDHNPCSIDKCDPSNGCYTEPAEDGTDCSGGTCGQASCFGGVCLPEDPAVCDDGNPCTRDGCTPERGCFHSNLADGTSCGSCQACSQGQCVEVPDCSEGCGCSSSSPAGGAAVSSLLLMMAALIRRKRR